MSLIKVLQSIVSHPLNQGQTLKAILGYARWQVGSRLVSGAVVYDWVNGSKFLVSTGETGLTGNIYNGFQEYAEMAFLIHALRGDDLFIDIGANVGSYTVLACAAVGARGWCFEPVPTTYARLLDNIRINHLESRVRCLNVGVGSTEGVLGFSSDMDAGNRVLADGEFREDRIEVQVATLDSLLAGESPVVLKIDVEGYETAVVKGADDVLRTSSLHSVIMEINGSGNKFGFDESQLFVYMLNYGFEAYTYAPARRKLIKLTPGRCNPENILFIRDAAHVGELLKSAPVFTVHGKQL